MTQAYTFNVDVVSDLHKDVYGFRPSQSFWAEWTHSTDAEKQRIWDDLLISLNAEIERERKAEQRAIAQFELLVAKTIEAGAANRETALRWIMESSDCNGDWEFFCFHYGLPYNYFRKAA